MLEKSHSNCSKATSLSTDVPACFSTKALIFQKKSNPRYWKTKSHLKVISLATSKVISLSTLGGQKSTQKSGQTNNFRVAKLITFNLLLAAVRMRFWQNGGQTNSSQKGQKVDKLITLQHIYIYICCRVKSWSNCCPCCVKTGPKFCFFVFEISFSLQKERD